MDPDELLALMSPGDLPEFTNRPAWHRGAACRGMDTRLFFPALGETTDTAKAICAVCPVQSDCLRVAIRDSDFMGIWGGTSERGRRMMRSELRKSA